MPGTTMNEPTSHSLTLETEPKPEDVRVLEERLYEFNVQATGLADGKLLAFFLRDRDGAAVGGVFGWTWGETGYVRYLFVPADMRNRGLGGDLMRAVKPRRERAGAGKSCWRRTTFRRRSSTVGSASRLAV